MSKENPCFVHEENMYEAQHYAYDFAIKSCYSVFKKLKWNYSKNPSKKS